MILLDIPPPGGAPGKFYEIFQDLGGGTWALYVSYAAALTYGAWFFRRPRSLPRTIAKTSAVGFLVLACLIGGGPPALIAGLALSALGDAFLAGESERRFRLGLASFLLAHIAYTALFLTDPLRLLDHPAWSLARLPPERFAAIGAVAVAAIAILAWLWPKLGAARVWVVAYVAAIVAMVASSLSLPPTYVVTMLGALLFFASDGLLAAGRFRGVLRGRLGDALVWWLYYLGQLGILVNFAGQPSF